MPQVGAQVARCGCAGGLGKGAGDLFPDGNTRAFLSFVSHHRFRVLDWPILNFLGQSIIVPQTLRGSGTPGILFRSVSRNRSFVSHHGSAGAATGAGTAKTTTGAAKRPRVYAGLSA